MGRQRRFLALAAAGCIAMGGVSACSNTPSSPSGSSAAASDMAADVVVPQDTGTPSQGASAATSGPDPTDAGSSVNSSSAAASTSSRQRSSAATKSAPKSEPGTRVRRTTSASTAPTHRVPSSSTPRSTQATSAQQQRIADVIRLTNNARRSAGCPALVSNPILNNVAQRYSTEMATKNFFDHNSPSGTTPFTRMRAGGYAYSMAAENIAAGQRTATEVVAGWMKSPGHRANIVNCGLREIGVGYAYNSASSYGRYWTQNFGTRG